MRSNGFQKHITVAVRLHNWLLIYSRLHVVGQTERARLFGFSTISPSHGVVRRTGMARCPPLAGLFQALAGEKQSEGAEHSFLPRVSFCDGEGGGFRMGCQPLTDRLLASDSLSIETRRTRQGGTTCEQKSFLLGFPPMSRRNFTLASPLNLVEDPSIIWKERSKRLSGRT